MGIINEERWQRLRESEEKGDIDNSGPNDDNNETLCDVMLYKC